VLEPIALRQLSPPWLAQRPAGLNFFPVGNANAKGDKNNCGGDDEAAAADRLEAHAEFKRLSSSLDHCPAGLATASRLARLCLEERSPQRARRTLEPWWESDTVPQELVLLRATILQLDHDFDEALDQLDHLRSLNPRHPQAWLMKSTIHSVSGDYEQAYASALPLFGIASPVVAATATTSALSLSGKAEQSYMLLYEKLSGEISESPTIRSWAFTTLAEIAVRLGKGEEAREHFEKALQAEPDNHYTRTMYGEFLIGVGDSRRAWKLIRNSVEGEAEQLVLALIEKKGARSQSKFADQLEQAYSAGSAKGLSGNKSYKDAQEF
jgi:tetratricopeptide (TPR) repeat protein